MLILMFFWIAYKLYGGGYLFLSLISSIFINVSNLLV